MRYVKSSLLKQELGKAVQEGKKNVLIVDRLLRVEKVNEWLDDNNDNLTCYCFKPGPMYYEDQGGILRRETINGEEVYSLSSNQLELLNRKNTVYFINFFGNDSVGDFDNLMNIVKSRYYYMFDSNGTRTKKVNVENLSLFIGITAPITEDMYFLTQDNYQYFDEILVIDD